MREQGLGRAACSSPAIATAICPRVLDALDVFALMAAGSDESCRAALEAMAAGRPVVARARGRAARGRGARAHRAPRARRSPRVGGAAPCARSWPTRAARAPWARRGGGGRWSDSARSGTRSRWRRSTGSSSPGAGACEGSAHIRSRVRALHLMSCRGWSSDAYWAACDQRRARARRAPDDARVQGGQRGPRDRPRAGPRASSASRRWRFQSGVHAGSDARDLRALLALAARGATSCTCTGARSTGWPPSPTASPAPRAPSCARATSCRPCARTPSTAGSTARATSLVVTVTEAIRRQYVAARARARRARRGAARGRGCRALPSRRRRRERFAARSASAPTFPSSASSAGLRVMKGHPVVVEVVRRLAERAAAFTSSSSEPERARRACAAPWPRPGSRTRSR